MVTRRTSRSKMKSESDNSNDSSSAVSTVDSNGVPEQTSQEHGPEENEEQDIAIKEEADDAEYEGNGENEKQQEEEEEEEEDGNEAEDDEDDADQSVDNTNDEDGIGESETQADTSNIRKALASRRFKNSNLNAVNRKRQQLTPVGNSSDTNSLDDHPDDEDFANNNNLAVENDEYKTPDDINGDKKITEMGVLKGGRQFRVKTFKIPNHGNRMYAVSTDVARLVGYRDSYFLFQKHTNLYRLTIDEESKMALINHDLLPGTFKTRAAYLITARSAFKEFGARIIVDGKQIIDDYYEDKARGEGAIEGALINPILSSDGYTNTVTDNQISLFERQKNIALLLASNQILETETSWVYDHALKCRQFDSMLFYDRNELLKKKVQRDIYTNLNFVPDITQPTCSRFSRLDDDQLDANDTQRKKLIFDTVIGGASTISTGLSTVPLDVFDGTVSDDVKEAILRQQKLERIL